MTSRCVVVICLYALSIPSNFASGQENYLFRVSNSADRFRTARSCRVAGQRWLDQPSWQRWPDGRQHPGVGRNMTLVWRRANAATIEELTAVPGVGVVAERSKHGRRGRQQFAKQGRVREVAKSTWNSFLVKVPTPESSCSNDTRFSFTIATISTTPLARIAAASTHTGSLTADGQGLNSH